MYQCYDVRFRCSQFTFVPFYCLSTFITYLFILLLYLFCLVLSRSWLSIRNTEIPAAWKCLLASLKYVSPLRILVIIVLISILCHLSIHINTLLINVDRMFSGNAKCATHPAFVNKPRGWSYVTISRVLLTFIHSE